MPDTEITEAHDWSKPFIFISYSHGNDVVMQKLFYLLKNAGYRVWYDEYIPSSANWRDEIALYIRNCTHFIAVINNEYIESTDCTAELEFATDKPLIKTQSTMCRPITPLYCEGATREMLSGGLQMYLRSYQDCTLNPNEELDENSKCFQKIIQNQNIAKCKIDAAQLNIQKLSVDNEDALPEDNISTTESVIAETADNFPEDSPVSSADKVYPPKMTTYMVRSALADRAHNAALLFSNTDEKIGCGLYKTAFQLRKDLINQYPENKKENDKFSALCSDINDFAGGRDIDVSEFFISDTDLPNMPDDTHTEENCNTAAYNYDLGIKLKKDGQIEAAEKYLRAAADNGMTEAQLSFGVLLYELNKKDEAEKYFRAAADNGAVKAQFNLGRLLYQTGRKTEAEKYIRLSADNGFIPAQSSFGIICKNKNDLEDAEKYFRMAADSGLSDTQYNLGILLKETDRLAEAVDYLQLAADKGHVGARSELAKIT